MKKTRFFLDTLYHTGTSLNGKKQNWKPPISMHVLFWLKFPTLVSAPFLHCLIVYLLLLKLKVKVTNKKVESAVFSFIILCWCLSPSDTGCLIDMICYCCHKGGHFGQVKNSFKELSDSSKIFVGSCWKKYQKNGSMSLMIMFSCYQGRHILCISAWFL